VNGEDPDGRLSGRKRMHFNLILATVARQDDPRPRCLVSLQ